MIIIQFIFHFPFALVTCCGLYQLITESTWKDRSHTHSHRGALYSSIHPPPSCSVYGVRPAGTDPSCQRVKVRVVVCLSVPAMGRFASRCLCWCGDGVPGENLRRHRESTHTSNQGLSHWEVRPLTAASPVCPRS